jgi:hypothetical protein
MTKIYTVTFLLLTTAAAMAQKPKTPLSKKASDHFMIQLGSTQWTGQPDSIKMKSLGRTLNVYFMLAFPFKSNPKLSTALGAGVASDGVFFNRRRVELTGTGDQLLFTNLDSQNHFKKYKLTTVYLEVPVELRFMQNPDNSDRSFKFAIGAKVGTVISTYTRGKTLEDKKGNAISNHIEKTRRRGAFINSTRLIATGRVGWGNFSVFGQYHISGLLKDGAGPTIRPWSVGITLSGL